MKARGETSAPEVSVLGIPVSVFDSYDAAVELVRQRVNDGQRTLCVALNPPKMYRALRDPKLRRVLHEADLRICDGVGVSWATLLLHGKWTRRVTGIQLFMDLIQLAAEEGWKIFILGASPESNTTACTKLRKSCPGLRIMGSRHGFFDDSHQVIREINASGADLLFVAMGTPRQEFWMSEHLPLLEPRLCMGIGGSLDAISGASRWAPRLVRGTGMEWLYRLVTQPRLLGRFRFTLLFALTVLRAAPGARLAAARPHRKGLPSQSL